VAPCRAAVAFGFVIAVNASGKLVAIKSLHTFVWACFVGCIVAIPFAAHSGSFRAAAVLIAIVLAEVVVIALNRGRCPLTPLAARYTSDRASNFDIFLPIWLARHNKTIFGALFVAALIYTLIAWTGRIG